MGLEAAVGEGAPGGEGDGVDLDGLIRLFWSTCLLLGWSTGTRGEVLMTAKKRKGNEKD